MHIYLYVRKFGVVWYFGWGIFVILVEIYSWLPMKIAFVNNIFVNTYMNNIIFIFCCHCATALDKLYVI